MKRLFSFINLGCLVLVFFCLTPSALTQSPLSPQESRGKEIYMLGTSRSGKDILAYIGDASLEVPGSAMACANCHGANGQGKSEGGIDPSNITWEALTKPYGVTHTSGRKHPPYTARGLEFAITRGLDPGGNKLLYAMPRYQMSQADLDDLVVYLKRLGTETDPGISEDKIVIGTALPDNGPLAEMGQVVKQLLTAYFADINQQGGIYNRRLELESVDASTDAMARRNAVERLVHDEKVFALTSVFLAGAESEVVPLLAASQVPVIGPMTLDPRPGNPVNRQVFYLLSGNADQARALVDFAARNPENKNEGLALVYYPSELNQRVVAAIKEEIEKEAYKSPQTHQYVNGSFNAPDMVRQLHEQAPGAVFFLGSSSDLFAFMKEAEKVNWFPQILLTAGAATREIFEAPSGFQGKIFFTAPTSPADQTEAGLREFQALVGKYKLPQKHVAAQLTAYSAARVLVEAMKRVGKDLTRDKLIQTLEGFYEYSTGLTPALSFGPNRRIGAMGAYVVLVDLKEKKFVPVGGWVPTN